MKRICLLTAMLSIQTYAADWQKIASGDGLNIYIDKETYQSPDSFQVQFEYDHDVDLPNTVYNAAIFTNSVRCNDRKMKGTYAVYYYNGEIVWEEPNNTGFKKPFAGGPGEAIVKAVCAHEESRANQKPAANPSKPRKGSRFNIEQCKKAVAELQMYRHAKSFCQDISMNDRMWVYNNITRWGCHLSDEDFYSAVEQGDKAFDDGYFNCDSFMPNLEKKYDLRLCWKNGVFGTPETPDDPDCQ